MIRRITILLVFCCLILANKAQADHISGGELFYRCVGPSQYQIVLHVYRNCAENNLPVSYTIQYRSASCNVSGSIALVRTGAPREFGLLCPTASSVCKGGNIPGIERHEYTAVLALSQPCSDWYFYWTDRYRESHSTTLAAPDSQTIYVDALLNNKDRVSNNAPVFLNPPVVSSCLFEYNGINLNAFDPDSQRVVFTLQAPQTDSGVFMNYLPGFNIPNILPSVGGVSFDTGTGFLAYTPDLPFNTNYTIKAEKYDTAGNLLGFVRRDIILTGEICSNRPPRLSGFDSGNSDVYNICLGDSMVTEIIVRDPDPGQNLSLQLTQLPPGMTSQIVGGGNFRSIRLAWKPAFWQIGDYRVTLSATDDGCPYLRQSSRQYTFSVKELPNLLPMGVVRLVCGQSVDIFPRVEKGNPPYAFQWSTGETQAVVKRNRGTYYLTVSDRYGCKDDDSVRVTSFEPVDFTVNGIVLPDIYTCPGKVNDFFAYGGEFPGTAADITRWRWDFGNGSRAVGRNIKLAYTTFGDYRVVLEATDSLGCIQVVEKTVHVCFPNLEGFKFKNPCEGNKTSFYEEVPPRANTCGKALYVDFGDGNTALIDNYRPGDTIGHVYKFTGIYNVTFATRDSCLSDTFQLSVNVEKSPEINLPALIYAQCNEMSSAVKLNPDFGLPPYSYRWNDMEIPEDSFSFTNYGVYIAQVTDARGCYAFKQISYRFPIIDSLNYAGYCSNGDVIVFKNMSQSVWGITRTDWDLGDGTTIADTLSVTHTYNAGNVYTVKMYTEDATGCRDTVTERVSVIIPEGEFSISKDTICQNELLYLFAPFGENVNRWEWNTGVKEFILPQSALLGHISQNYPPAGGTFDISLKLVYNNGRCSKTYDTTLYVYPRFAATVNVDQLCFGDSSRFTLSNFTGNFDPVSYLWQFGEQRDTFDIAQPIYFFKTPGTNRIQFTMTDEVGCRYEELMNRPVPRPDTPCFSPSPVCMGKLSTFKTFDFCVLSENHDYFEWNMGNGTTLQGTEVQYQYATSGTVPVTVTAVSRKVLNVTNVCRTPNTRLVKIFEPPKADLLSDTVCLRENLLLNASGSIFHPEDPPSQYIWMPGDGITQYTADDSLYYPYLRPGTYLPQVVVVSQAGCTDTAVATPAWVKPIPTSVFSTDAFEADAYSPIFFTDESKGNPVMYYWNFGDGTALVRPTGNTVSHTYTSVDKFTVSLAVENKFNCFDTSQVLIDLNAYFSAPNAFTPNGDGLNDQFFIIHKGISELKSLKIYNRWGQQVFDGKGEINSSWDGTINGKDQPSGEYFYEAEGITVYGDIRKTGGKLTLIR